MRTRMKEEGQPKRRTWTETGSSTPVHLYLTVLSEMSGNF